MLPLKKCIALAALSVAFTGCAHSPTASAPPSPRAAVLRAVVDHVLEARQADIPEIDPAPLTTSSCACEGRKAFLSRELPSLQPSTFESYCLAPPAKLGRTELRALNPLGVFESRVGRPRTPLQFSAVGFSSDSHQALVCVREFAEDVFYLIDARDSSWQVTDSTVSIFY
jgi:hypothetical protein